MSKRKSFLIHIDSLDILDDLSDEQAGQLFKAIKSHQQGRDVELSPIVKIAFSPFKNQFARDDVKYEKLCEKNRLIAEKRYATKSTTGKTGDQPKPNVTKSTDNKNDSDSDSDSDNKDLNVPSKTKRSKFNYSDDDFRFAEEMFKRVTVINPSAKKPNFESWANTIRLMREIDDWNHTQMWKVFDWANKDSFWCSNVLSPDKLRKQFDKLQVKANETNQSANAPSGMSTAQAAIAAARKQRDSAQGGLSVGPNDRNLHGQVDQEEWSGRVIDMD